MYEAAAIDGASPWTRFWKITFPMLYPAFFTVTVLAVGISFGIFTEVYQLTGGGPNFATNTWQMEIYNQAFVNLKSGYASAVALMASVVTFASIGVIRKLLESGVKKMVGNKRTKGKNSVLYLVTTLVMLLMTFPFVYLVLHSFAAWDQVDRKIIPTTFSLRSWTWLFGGSATSADVPWIGAFVNTTIVATIATFLMMVFALMVGYALAKIEFKGKKFVNHFILFQMFFPAIILLIPQFLMVTKVGLLDSYVGMIIPTAISLWAIFMYTNFFKAIPDALIEAAKLDGATEMQVLFKVVLPMSKSITTVIFLFLFTDRWTNLLWDMIVSKSDATVTLNVLISQMFGPYGTYPVRMYAASVADVTIDPFVFDFFKTIPRWNAIYTEVRRPTNVVGKCCIL